MTRHNPHPVRFESVVFYLRDPTVGEMQREAFERAAGDPRAVLTVNMRDAVGGPPYLKYTDSGGNEHVCPVGCGMVVFDHERKVADVG